MVRHAGSTALVVLLAACASAPYSSGARDAARRPGGPVAAAAPAAPALQWPEIVINEVLPGNDSVSTDEALEYDDWVELYNPTAQDVDLTGWGLADDLNSPDWVFPAGTVIPAGGHLLAWADEEPAEGPLHATFSLGGDGDELGLFSPDEVLQDEFVWLNHPDDVVLGRFPSGGPFITSSIQATPANANPFDPGLSLDPSDALFPADDVIRIDIFMSDEAYQALLANNASLVEASVGFQGAYLPSVQLRIKGQIGSNRQIYDKAAFKIDLDEFVPGQRLRGLENLTLNNMVQDVSGVHETLGYRLMRDSGVPAPRTAHATVYLNGEYRGLYLNVESPDDQFLKRWFADPNGNLYEGEYGQDVDPAYLWSLTLDEQGIDDVTDRSELLSLAQFLDQTPTEALMPELEARVDLDRTLHALAVEVLIGHWDGYFYYPNNWRIYHEPSTDDWTVLPWGIDQTFASELDIHDADGDVAEFCLDIPSCATRWHLALWDVAEEMLELDCAARVDEMLARNLPLYTADPYREGTPTDMENVAYAAVDFCEYYPLEVLAEVFPGGLP